VYRHLLSAGPCCLLLLCTVSGCLGPVRADGAGQPKDTAWYDAGASDRAGTDRWRPDVGLHDSARPDAPGQDRTVADANPADSGTTDLGCPTCGEVQLGGLCDGDLLSFCDNGCLITRDCAAQQGGPFHCGPLPPEEDWYECLASIGQACEPDYFDCAPGLTCTGNYPCDPALGLVCESEICVEAIDAGATDI